MVRGMKLTGKQLFEMYAEISKAAAWIYYVQASYWDALAEKLNEMKGEGWLNAPPDPLCKSYWQTGDERTRHHATCPYRHGTGSCSC